MTAKKAESATPTLEPPPTPTPPPAPPPVPDPVSLTVRTGGAVATKVPVALGIAPRNIEEGWRLAQYMANSSLVPKNFQNKPEDVLVAIQMGIEIGFAPMAALQSIAVINGRPSLWGDGFLALIMTSPLYEDHDESFEVDGQRRDGLLPEDFKNDTTAAICTFIRRRKQQPVTRRFTVGQARKAGLLGKPGPWQEYPDRMLQMRARSLAGRDCFPDLLRGLRPAEEARDLPNGGNGHDAPMPAPIVQRKSEMPVAAASARPAPPAPATVDIGPVRVTDVVDFLGGYTVHLSNGQQVDTIDSAEALEVEKFKGRQEAIVLTCTPSGESLQLQSFRIAD